MNVIPYRVTRRFLQTTLCVVILLLFAFAAIADERTVAPDGEPKLSKTITLSLRAATLKEVLASVEKATGVHLLVQREIAEDKATVWAKDQPRQRGPARARALLQPVLVPISIVGQAVSAALDGPRLPRIDAPS